MNIVRACGTMAWRVGVLYVLILIAAHTSHTVRRADTWSNCDHGNCQGGSVTRDLLPDKSGYNERPWWLP
jgi:hypothetical protein